MPKGGWRPGAGRKPNNPARDLPALPGLGDTYTPPAPTAQQVAELITPDPNRGGTRPKAGRPKGRKDLVTIIKQQAAAEAAKIMQASHPDQVDDPTWTMETMLAAFANSKALSVEERAAAAKSMLNRRPEEMLQVLRRIADNEEVDVAIRTRCANYVLEHLARQPVVEHYPIPEDVAQRVGAWATEHRLAVPETKDEYKAVYLAMGPLVFAQVLDIRMAGGKRVEAAPHLVLISNLIKEAAITPCRKIVSMPPRHGKSELISFVGPIWLLAIRPDRRIIMTGYESDFATTWGRRVRNAIMDRPWLGVTITQDSSAAGRWDTVEGGSMTSTGIGGAITGRGADFLVLDDYAKNRADADSETKRKSTWDWWTSTAYTRLEPGSSCIIVATRWHHDDLIGRLLEQEAVTGEHWEYLRLRAIAEGDDPLGRKPGEALWPARYDEKALKKIELTIGTRDWSALYQQHPSDDKTGMFKRENLRYWRRIGERILQVGDRQIDMSRLRRFATSDLALGGKQQNDYTVICHWGYDQTSGLLLMLDMSRQQMTGPEGLDELEACYHRWKPNWLGIESSSFGLLAVQALRRKGLPIKELIADRDKVSRAQMAAVMSEGGQLWLPADMPDLAIVERELFGFPKVAHDDVVDNVAYAALACQGNMVAESRIKCSYS